MFKFRVVETFTGCGSIYKYQVEHSAARLSLQLSVRGSVGKTRLNGSSICAAWLYPLSAARETALLASHWTTAARLGQWACGDRDGEVVDIDDIEMTEGNYVELSWGEQLVAWVYPLPQWWSFVQHHHSSDSLCVGRPFQFVPTLNNRR